MNRISLAIALAASCLVLNACRQEAPPAAEGAVLMEQTGRLPETGSAPPPDFANAPSSAYAANGRRNPFAPPSSRGKPATEATVKGPVPNRQRPRQHLEGFRLSDLAWAGLLSRGADRRALVRDGDGEVHQVRVGDYLGGHHGRVQRIGDASIELLELVPDGAGGWKRQRRTLAAAPEEATP